MEAEIQQLRQQLSTQEGYFDTLMKLGLLHENNGNDQKAFETFKIGLQKIRQAEALLSEAMLGLMD